MSGDSPQVHSAYAFPTGRSYPITLILIEENLFSWTLLFSAVYKRLSCIPVTINKKVLNAIVLEFFSYIILMIRSTVSYV